MEKNAIWNLYYNYTTDERPVPMEKMLNAILCCPPGPGAGSVLPGRAGRAGVKPVFRKNDTVWVSLCDEKIGGMIGRSRNHGGGSIVGDN